MARAKKLLTPAQHEHGPRGWQGTLSRDDAREIGGILACAFGEYTPRGGEKHRRLVRALVSAQQAGDVFLSGDDARTVMSAFRLAHGDSLAWLAREEETLETGDKVYPVRSWKSRLLQAFKDTFPRGDLFAVDARAV